MDDTEDARHRFRTLVGIVPEPTLNDLSLRVGGLTAKIDNLEAAVTRLVDSQTKVVENFTMHSVSALQFEEYRKTGHERNNHIHERLGVLDEAQSKIERRIDHVERDFTTRSDTTLMRSENLVQAVQFKYEARLVDIEKLTNEWKGGLRATHAMAFACAAFLGSLIGYIGEIALHMVTK